MWQPARFISASVSRSTEPTFTEQIQVFDGTTWVTVWDTLNSPIQIEDTAWVHELHDISLSRTDM